MPRLRASRAAWALALLGAAASLALLLYVSRVPGAQMRALADPAPFPDASFPGYDAAQVGRVLQAAEDRGATEALAGYFRLDLALPLLYGPSLALLLALQEVALGRPRRLRWTFLLPAVGALADLAENLAWLRFAATGEAPAGLVGLASFATRLKLLLLVASVLLALALALRLGLRRLRRRRDAA